MIDFDESHYRHNKRYGRNQVKENDTDWSAFLSIRLSSLHTRTRSASIRAIVLAKALRKCPAIVAMAQRGDDWEPHFQLRRIRELAK